MKITVLLKTYFTGLLALLFLAYILLINNLKISYPIEAFRQNHDILSTLLICTLIFIPTIWLIRSGIWSNTTSTLRKALLLALSLFLLSTAYSIRLGINFGGFFMFMSAIYGISERKFQKPTLLLFLCWLYFFYQALSLCWTEDLHLGYYKLRTYFPFITIPLAFSCFILIKEEIDSIILVFFRAAFIFVGISLMCWVYESNRLGLPLTDWFVTHKDYFTTKSCYEIVYCWTPYVHPTYNAFFYITAMVLGFYLVNTKSKTIKINKVELTVFIMACAVLIDITQSRIAFLTMVMILLIGTAWINRKNQLILRAYLFITLCLGGFILIDFHSKIENFVADPARNQLYETAFAYIKSNYVLGTGIGGMPKVLDSQEFAQSLGFPGAITGIGNPHNQFVGDIMQTGLGGFITLCILISYLFYDSFKKRNWILLAFLFSFLPIMIIEMPLTLFKGITYFVPLVFFLYQWRRENELNCNSD